MNETDFFRMARDKFGDYTITIRRESTLGGKPYKVALQCEGRLLYTDGTTLPEALSDLAARAGVDRRAKPRADVNPATAAEDRTWPGG